MGRLPWGVSWTLNWCSASLNVSDSSDLSWDVQCASRWSVPKPASSCSVWIFFSSVLGRGRRGRGFYRQRCGWFRVQTQPFIRHRSSSSWRQLLGADPGRLFCFDWRIHSCCQDFRISFLMSCDSWCFTATRRETWAEIVTSQTKRWGWLVGIKAKGVAHPSEKLTLIYTGSGQCVLVIFWAWITNAT